MEFFGLKSIKYLNFHAKNLDLQTKIAFEEPLNSQYDASNNAANHVYFQITVLKKMVGYLVIHSSR